MTRTYRGECEELYGQQIEYPDHYCLEHLRYREERHRETHGLDCGPYEEWTDHWHECTICNERFDDADLCDLDAV